MNDPDTNRDGAPAAPPALSAAETWLTPSVRIGLVLLVLVGILSVIMASWRITWGVRSTLARTKADMRTLATAIETYYVDCMTYPAMTMTLAETPDLGRHPAGAPVGRTFRMRNDTMLGTLTTPIAYLTSYPRDRFVAPHRVSYRFYHARSGWMLGSFGPDSDLREGGQLLWHEGDLAAPRTGSSYESEVLPDALIERVYDPTISMPSDELLAGSGPRGAYTYDPTNGAFSVGDVWRVRN